MKVPRHTSSKLNSSVKMQKAEGEIGNIMWQYISYFKTEGKPMIYVGGGIVICFHQTS